jgi:cyclin-dependent kinase 8/11
LILGRTVAVKEFKTPPIQRDPKTGEAKGNQRIGMAQPTFRETTLLRAVRHVNVVRLHHIIVDKKEASLSLAIDYAEYDLGVILSWHRARRRMIHPRMVKSVAWQLLHGLHYLHSNWIMHRDIKPQNVLIMGDGSELGVVKIADFGLARYCDPDSLLRPLHENGPVVTLWYRAPELLLGARHYTRAVDIWAAGCIFAELATLAVPFKGIPKAEDPRSMFCEEQIEAIVKVKGTPTEDEWPNFKYHPYLNRAKHVFYPDEHPKGQPAATSLDSTFANEDELFVFQELCRYDPERRPTAYEALTNIDYFSTKNPQPQRNVFEYEYTGEGERIVYPHRKIRPTTTTATEEADRKRAKT